MPEFASVAKVDESFGSAGYTKVWDELTYHDEWTGLHTPEVDAKLIGKKLNPIAAARAKAMGEGGRPKRVSAYARDWADLRDPSSLKGDAMSLKAPLFTRLNKAYRKPTKHEEKEGEQREKLGPNFAGGGGVDGNPDSYLAQRMKLLEEKYNKGRLGQLRRLVKRLKKAYRAWRDPPMLSASEQFKKAGQLAFSLLDPELTRSSVKDELGADFRRTAWKRPSADAARARRDKLKLARREAGWEPEDPPRGLVGALLCCFCDTTVAVCGACRRRAPCCVCCRPEPPDPFAAPDEVELSRRARAPAPRRG